MESKIFKSAFDDNNYDDEEESKTVVRPQHLKAAYMKEVTTTIKKGTASSITFELTKYDTLLTKQIRSDFKEIFDRYGQDAVIQATCRQTIIFSEDKDLLKLEDEEAIREFLIKYSINFSRMEDIQLLGKGGEAIVFNITPYLPIEVIAKVPLITEDNFEVFAG